MVSNQGINRRAWLLPVVAITIALMALAFWAATSMRAEAQVGSDKTGYAMSEIAILTEDDVNGAGGASAGWVEIMASDLHTPNNQDTMMAVSLECSLMTETTVKSKGGKQDVATAEAGVKVRVLVDGVEAAPGPVTFCRRSQMLAATFQGLLTDDDGNVCLIIDPDTGLITIDEECLRYEELQLILNTTNANAFFFSAPVDVGDHVITVEATVAGDYRVEAGNGSAAAIGTIGKGALVVEQVDLYHGNGG